MCFVLSCLYAAPATVAPELMKMLKLALEDLGSRERPVVSFASPAELLGEFEQSVPLAFPRQAEPHPVEALARALETVIARSVHTDHPRFFNQNFAGSDPVSVVGDVLGAALNTTLATYEAAPVFALMERAVAAHLAARIGWPAVGLDGGDPAGVLCPGGSTANLYALQLARHRADPEVLKRGAQGGPRLVAFTSATSHYSFRKAVRLLGLGDAALRLIEVDDNGAMVPEALRVAIAAARGAGEVPFFLNLTAGTTVTGAFDSVEELLPIARESGLWVHVDGAIGGAVLFSERERYRLAGVEAVDSLTWNLHKLSGVTQQCSFLLLREPGRLRACFSSQADYLFQPDKNHTEYDAGDLSFQCARRNDALKAWLTLKARGTQQLGARVEHAVDLAARLSEHLSARPGFVLAAPTTFTHVCFWWVPPELRPFDPAKLDSDAAVQLHALAPRVKDRLQREGSALLGYQPIAGGPNAWRLLCINPQVEFDDLLFVVDAIERLGTETICEGQPDCADASDEVGCAAPACEPTAG